MIRKTLIACMVFFLGATAQSAAAAITDPANDLLPTFTGTPAGDLDVLSAQVFYNSNLNTFTLTATLNGIIDTAVHADPLLYVWGFDRGQGAELFLGGAPSIGAGVFFDSVVAFVPQAGIALVIADLTTGNQVVGGALSINGSTISATIDAALLPGNTAGRGFADYTFNLWPRVGLSGNANISDFAPDAGAVAGVSTNAAVDVPSPRMPALIGTGLVALLLFRRRQHTHTW